MNNAASSASPRRELRIALLKPACVGDERVAHAMQLLNSMLWAFRGSTRSAWTTSTPEDADVIVIHQDDDDTRIAEWRADGKLVVEISTNGRSETGALYSLVYPFRAAQARSLLEKLDACLQGTPAPVEGSDNLDLPSSSGSETDPTVWRFVEGLRAARERASADAWYVALSSGAPALWFSADGATYMAEASIVQAIRLGSLSMSALSLEECPKPTQSSLTRPGAELAWFTGYHASDRLAPWLKRTARYRIRRWPNFSSIRPAVSQIRVAAAMAAGESEISRIASRAHVPAEEAVRALNALSACDVLTFADSSLTVVSAGQSLPVEPRGGFSSFLRNVRKHLGLGDRA